MPGSVVVVYNSHMNWLHNIAASNPSLARTLTIFHLGDEQFEGYVWDGYFAGIYRNYWMIESHTSITHVVQRIQIHIDLGFLHSPSLSFYENSSHV